MSSTAAARCATTGRLIGNVRRGPTATKRAQSILPAESLWRQQVAAHWFRQLREAYDLFICQRHLFIMRARVGGETFVTRKVSRAVSRLARATDKLYLEP